MLSLSCVCYLYVHTYLMKWKITLNNSHFKKQIGMRVPCSQIKAFKDPRDKRIFQCLILIAIL